MHYLHITILSSSKSYKLADLNIFVIDIKYIQYPSGVNIMIELKLSEFLISAFSIAHKLSL